MTPAEVGARELEPSNREIKTDAALTEGTAVGAHVRARSVLGTRHAYVSPISSVHCRALCRDTGDGRRRRRGERSGPERDENASRSVPLRSRYPGSRRDPSVATIVASVSGGLRKFLQRKIVDKIVSREHRSSEIYQRVVHPR